MEREACVCDHGFGRSDLGAEIIITLLYVMMTIFIFKHFLGPAVLVYIRR